MKIDILLLAGGLLALVVAALSERMRRIPVSEPLLGLLAGILLGPAVAGVLPVASFVEDHTWVHTATRILLAISVIRSPCATHSVGPASPPGRPPALPARHTLCMSDRVSPP
jgi:hypothetical protein